MAVSKTKRGAIHVAYIWGKADAAKTTYPRRVLGLSSAVICKVHLAKGATKPPAQSQYLKCEGIY